MSKLSTERGGRSSADTPHERTSPRPVILMSPDLRERDGRTLEREYVVRTNYAEAVSEAGGVPLLLSLETELIDDVVALADGLLITGSVPGAEVSSQRVEFERRLVERAIAAKVPLMGICHGMQLIGEQLGGRLSKSLPGLKGDAGVHIPDAIADRLAHDITLETESVLAEWHGASIATVNSLHRHALIGHGRYRVAARAPDGVIEAFEGLTDGFCLGVQWHPEYRLTSLDRRIFSEFVGRCTEFKRSRTARKRGSDPSVATKLEELGLKLPQASVPPGAFVGAIRTGDMVTVSGQVPLKDGQVLRTGHLGKDVTIEEGRDCARWALMNALAQLEQVAGGFHRVRGFVRLAGYVAATPTFTQHGQVVDGASELLKALFPQVWPHARVALGVASLPRGVPVEIELSALVDGER